MFAAEGSVLCTGLLGDELAAQVHLLEHLACNSIADASTAASASSYMLARMLADSSASLDQQGGSPEELKDVLVRHLRLKEVIEQVAGSGAP